MSKTPPESTTSIREVVGAVSGLQTFWDFTPSEPALSIRLTRLRGRLFNRFLRPDHQIIKPVTEQDNWLVYFVFAPDGQISASHRFTLSRLKDTGYPLFVICAAPAPQHVPHELTSFSDALCWKGMDGYDYSAYTLALETVAQHSAHANVMIMNDSMFGPFTDLRPFLGQAPWDLTGFTSSSLYENHLQSYAFILRNVNRAALQNLPQIFPSTFAYSHPNYVIKCQELAMARITARHLSVGAYWHADGNRVQDACLNKPFELLEAGFPFMKKSLLGKFQIFQNPEVARGWLARFGHPLV